MEVNNCPSCGGKIEYSPSAKALKCEKCAKLFPVAFKQALEKKRIAEALGSKQSGFKKWQKSKRTFHCENCGAEIILNSFEMSTRCSYCNTSSLVPIDKLPGLKPDAVVPFTIDKDKACEVFKQKVRGKFFLPNKFKKNLPNIEIGATYISSFSYDMVIHADYHGLRAETEIIGSGENRRTVVKLVPFSGHIDKNYDNIVVEMSEKISQYQINAILPYNFTESYEYNDDFITGYSVEYYNQSAFDATSIAQRQALSLTEHEIRIRHSPVRSLTVRPTYSNVKYSYVLLPLYFVNFKYKEKEYFNLMNGQTGNTSGKVPRSPVKITFFSVLMALLVIGFPLLIFLLS